MNNNDTADKFYHIQYNYLSSIVEIKLGVLGFWGFGVLGLV